MKEMYFIIAVFLISIAMPVITIVPIAIHVMFENYGLTEWYAIPVQLLAMLTPTIIYIGIITFCIKRSI